MMSTTLAILTIGVVSLGEILPLLTEHIREDQITYVNLLGKLSREDVEQEYTPTSGEERIIALLNDNQLIEVSKAKIERDIQAVIEVLDNQGFDVILLMSSAPLNGLTARNAVLLEPQRVIPPLVSSIVHGHQMGVIVPVPELLNTQRNNWLKLPTPPCYALANPLDVSDDELISAARQLLDAGADVLMLDSQGFHLHHLQLLQKALGVPVLLSNALLARLTVELLM